MLIDTSRIVVGYIYRTSGKNVFCHNRACVVFKSPTSLRKRVGQSINADQIIKAHFADIVMVMELTDARYAFELPAYRRFYKLIRMARPSWDLIHPDAVCGDLANVGFLTLTDKISA